MTVFLVPWHARIVENQDQWEIEFHSLNCSPTLDIELDNFGYTLLQGENLELEVLENPNGESCWGTLNGTDGRSISFANNTNSASKQIGAFSSIGMIDSTPTFSGHIQCANDVFDIKTTVTTVGTIPLGEEMRLHADIKVDEPTYLQIPYVGEGEDQENFLLMWMDHYPELRQQILV